MTTWLTSDTHFGHANLCRPDYCDRPYKKADGSPDVQAMNKDMITKWNARVKPGDYVFHLGDFAFGSKAMIAEYRRALNGTIILVRGNHDRSEQAMRECGFDEVYEQYNLHTSSGLVLLQHKPNFDFDTNTYIIEMNGHVHERWFMKPSTDGRRTLLNVGVDQHSFQPISLEEALDYRLRPLHSPV